MPLGSGRKHENYPENVENFDVFMQFVLKIVKLFHGFEWGKHSTSTKLGLY